MVEIAQIKMNISGCREADTPATYAQRGMWWAMGVMSEDDAFFNEGWTIPVPGGARIDEVITVFRRVVERFDTFRTTFHSSEGTLRQIVAAGGSLVVRVHDCGAATVEDAAEDVLQKLVSTGFRADVEWPIRLAIVVKDERAQALVLGVSHLAIDLRGWRVVERTIARLLTDPSMTIPEEVGWQPVDVAAYESSRAGQAANEAALDRWRRILSSAPPSMFDFDTVPEERDRYWQLRMTSSALAMALTVVADRTRISNSAVLIAAASTVFGRYSGHTETVGHLNVANRIVEESENVVGYLCWDSLFHVESEGLSFDEISRRCFRAALDSYCHGEYDRAQALAIQENAEYRLGAKIDLGWQFNDCREAIGSVAELALSAPYDFDARRDETRIAFVDSWPHIGTRFYIDVYDEPDSIAIELLCDTRYIPVAAMHRILRAIESLLIAATERDLTPDEIDRSIDLPLARSGTGWIRHGKGWVNFPALRQAWLDLVGPSAATFAEPLSDGTFRLVAYSGAARGYRGVGDVHTAFVRALGDRTDICAPDHYIQCSDTPMDISDKDEWNRCAVTKQGTGRDGREPSAAGLDS
ncbi:condensation domain-containing protein [Streptomyces sp. NPDC015501]|uniref:condensation domain-containing protein n=1 Tax=unclassified Streptomyces TaxID=2593676 RepID=UPI0011A9045D|nr:hypothetical protein A3L22_30535 [Streptomyces griseus subsp. griseus]